MLLFHKRCQTPIEAEEGYMGLSFFCKVCEETIFYETDISIVVDEIAELESIAEHEEEIDEV